jgi:hypothetical protein
LGITGEAIGRQRRDHLLAKRQELLASLSKFLPFESSSHEVSLIRETITISVTEFNSLLELLSALDVSASLLCEVENHLRSLHSTVLMVCEKFMRETVRLISEVLETLSLTMTPATLLPLTSLFTQSLYSLWRVERTIPNGRLLLEVLQRNLASSSLNLENSKRSGRGLEDEDDWQRRRHAHDITRYRLSAAALDLSFLYGGQQQFEEARHVVEIGLSASSDWISAEYLTSATAAPQYIFIHLSLLSFYGQYLMLLSSLSSPSSSPLSGDVQQLAIESVRRSLDLSAMIYRQISAEKMTFCRNTLDIHLSGLSVLQEKQEKRRAYERILEIVEECQIALSENQRGAIIRAMSGL